MTQNKNDGNERVINNISELSNNNNKKILELEAKLIHFENCLKIIKKRLILKQI